MRSRWVLLGAVAAVVVLLLGLGWWKVVDHRPRVEAGQVGLADPFDDDPPSAHTVAVRTPTITFDLAVGDRTEELPPHCCVQSRADHRAPSGGSFVGVHVSTPTPMKWSPSDTSGWSRPVLTLVEAGRRYPLTSINDYLSPRGPWTVEGMTEYLALPDRPDHVEVEVEYDGGGTQVYDTADDRLDRGLAAPLYAMADRPAAATPCVDRWPAPYAPLRGRGPVAEFSANTFPWVPGLGWARKGRTWLMGGFVRHAPSFFTVRTAAGAGRGHRVLYDNTAADPDTYTLAEAVHELTVHGVHPRGLYAPTSTHLGATVVWDEPAGADPTVRARVQLVGEQVEGPAKGHQARVVVRASCR